MIGVKVAAILCLLAGVVEVWSAFRFWESDPLVSLCRGALGVGGTVTGLVVLFAAASA